MRSPIIPTIPSVSSITWIVTASTHRSVSAQERGLLERAGPRHKLYFAPGHVRAGIVTCGGLCPGINDVIRAVVRCLWYRYGVQRISGIRFGYSGLLPEKAGPVLELNPDVVDDIHKIGGTVLGSSRGGGDRTADIVDSVERLNLSMLFTIGGDGTQKRCLGSCARDRAARPEDRGCRDSQDDR